MKISLLIEKKHPDNGGVRSTPLTMALPFYKSKRGEYVHRVRSGQMHQWKDWPQRAGHISLRMWCGGAGFLDTKGELFAVPPERAVHCAICEGKATGAGLNGAREICGRTVLFRPRI